METNRLHQRCHSFVAQSEGRELVIVHVPKTSSGEVQLQTEHGIELTKVGDGEYITPDGYRLRSGDPERP